MKQKDIWLIDFDPVKGSEQRGVRPGVVVSGNSMNEHSGLAIVCPLTSKIKSFAGCVVISPNNQNGLELDSEVLTFQIRVITKHRLVKKLGELTDSQLAEIKEGLNDILTY